MSTRALPAALLTLALAAGAACAADPGALFTQANAVGSDELAHHRGGFAGPDGLVVSLGVERIVTINGALAEHSTVELGDIGKLASGGAALSQDALAGIRVIQNGAAAYTAAMAPGVLAGTIIQNSLDDQAIRSQTTINAAVNTAGMLQAMNFQTSLGNALTNAIALK